MFTPGKKNWSNFSPSSIFFSNGLGEKKPATVEKIPSKELTYPPKMAFWVDDFPFPFRWDMLIPRRVFRCLLDISGPPKLPNAKNVEIPTPCQKWTCGTFVASNILEFPPRSSSEINFQKAIWWKNKIWECNCSWYIRYDCIYCMVYLTNWAKLW